MRKITLVLTALSVLFVGGCFATQMTIGVTEAKPNVDVLGMSEKKIALAFGENLLDQFSNPASGNGCMGLTVQQWHTSLTKGFVNGFRDSFTVADAADEADFIINIVSAEPFLEITAVRASTGAPAACGVNITYKARLVEGGEEVKSSSHTVIAKQRAGDVQNNLGSAIESMYEVIAKDFFGEAT